MITGLAQHVFMNKFFSLVLIIFLSQPILAATGGKRGTSGAQELLIPVGGRGTALGGSMIANVFGAEALYWNPAGIAQSPKQFDILFFHQNHLYDIAHVFTGFTAQIGEAGTIGLQVKYLDVGKIPVTTIDQPNGTGATYSPSFITYGVSFARNFTDMITLGATAKLVTEKVMEASAVGFAFDVGLQYKTGVEGLLLGFVIQNIGDNMRFDGESLNEPNTLYPRRTFLASFPLPTTIQIGISYDYRLDDVNTIVMNGKVQSNSFDTDQYVTGIEYNYNRQLFLRGSYEFHGDAQSDPFGKSMFTYDFALGAGVRIQPTDETEVTFEYAFRNSDTFAGNHGLGIAISL